MTSTREIVGRFGVLALIGSAMILACSSDDAAGAGSSSGDGGASSGGGTVPPKDALNSAPGTLGGDCETDAQCTPGLKCLAPYGIPSGTKFCASTCNVPADCENLAKASFLIQVPLDPDGFGPNQWNRTVLERGVVCAEPTAGSGQKYCQFFCPENSAIEDQAKGCACLPRYKPVKNAAGELLRCEWSENSACSIIDYPGRKNRCDCANSKPLIAGCYTGDYRCAVNRSFNGDCYQWSDIQTVSGCLAAQTSDCDEGCYERCAGSGSPGSPGVATQSNCLKLCCKPSTRPANQPPACNGSASGGASGGASSSSSSSGGPTSSSSTSSSSSSASSSSSGGDQ